MDFTSGESTIAGSAGAILEIPGVREVFSEFGDGCLKCYGVDISTKRTFTNSASLRQVASFTEEYGSVDAKKIITQLFCPLHNGVYYGTYVGMGIFSRKWRWFANKLLLECGA